METPQDEHGIASKASVSRRKKVLLAAPYFLLWLLYVFLTMEKRTEWMMAEEKGMKCMGSKFDGFYYMGTVTKYYFDPNQKPLREFITWREFWKARGY